jgi:hypothetical protein
MAAAATTFAGYARRSRAPVRGHTDGFVLELSTNDTSGRNPMTTRTNIKTRGMHLNHGEALVDRTAPTARGLTSNHSEAVFLDFPLSVNHSEAVLPEFALTQNHTEALFGSAG